MTDSTTIHMMAEYARTHPSYSPVTNIIDTDSIQRAVNDTAEYILYRHDMILLFMAIIPSLALVSSVLIYVNGKKERA